MQSVMFTDHSHMVFMLLGHHLVKFAFALFELVVLDLDRWVGLFQLAKCLFNGVFILLRWHSQLLLMPNLHIFNLWVHITLYLTDLILILCLNDIDQLNHLDSLSLTHRQLSQWMSFHSIIDCSHSFIIIMFLLWPNTFEVIMCFWIRWLWPIVVISAKLLNQLIFAWLRSLEGVVEK